MLLSALFLTLAMDYPWQHSSQERKISHIPPPAGFERAPVPPDGFANWLRGLPLKPGRPPVTLHNGRRKPNQKAHHAVVAIDTGKRDLQQCADAVIRLRAEYLFSKDLPVAFNFTSGDRAHWEAWRDGQRPKVQGNKVQWQQSSLKDASYDNFRRYLRTLFTYAGTYSLNKEMEKVADPSQVQIGDVFIQGGFPGHAVIVVDVATKPSGERAFLLVQSYMPAQDMHVLRGPLADAWYPAKATGSLVTPEWTFAYRDLRRFAPTLD